MARGEITRGRLRSNYRASSRTCTCRESERHRSMRERQAPGCGPSAVGSSQDVRLRLCTAHCGSTTTSPIELLWNNDHPPPGIIARNERFTCDEVVEIHGMAVATIQRTAFDIGRHLKRDEAVKHLDALANATGLKSEHVCRWPICTKGRGYSPAT